MKGACNVDLLGKRASEFGEGVDSARGVAAIVLFCRSSSCYTSCDAIVRSGRKTFAFFLLFRVQYGRPNFIHPHPPNPRNHPSRGGPRVGGVSVEVFLLAVTGYGGGSVGRKNGGGGNRKQKRPNLICRREGNVSKKDQTDFPP